MSRRRLFKIAGRAGLLYVGGRFALHQGRLVLADKLADGAFDSAGSKPKDPTVWFAIGSDGIITFHSPKMEMGQGILSALAQIAVEELGVRPDQIQTVQGEPSRLNADGMATFGSSSISSMYKPVRETAALMREMLRHEAAAQLSVPVESIQINEGRCETTRDPKTSLTFGAIVAAKRGPWVTPKGKIPLKAPKDFTSIGKDFARVDVSDKLLGVPTYAYDARVEGMLYGAVARPPRFQAKLSAATPGEAANLPGVVKVVIDKSANFVGVVAKTRSQAHAAIKKVDVTWDSGSSIDQSDVEAKLTAKRNEGTLIRRHGDAGDAIGDTPSSEALYRTPFAAHAHLEPISATVHVADQLVEAWVPSQSPGADLEELKPWSTGRQVLLHPRQMGGSFGRKGTQTIVAEAARLSAAVGKPVHVGWTRAEEMQHSFYRPATSTWMRGKVDANGKVLAVEQVTNTANVSVDELPSIVRSLLGFDFSVIPGLFLEYDIKHYNVKSNWIDLPVRTGIWRGVGLYPNVFAVESFIDELAAAAKKDPLEFRLQNVGLDEHGKRMKAVLEDVRKKSNWDDPVRTGRARGVAYSHSTGTHVAMVCELTVDNNRIIVERVTASVDCGMVINPVNAGLQAKGSIVMGLSSTLLEEITVRGGAVVQQDFDDYPILTLAETPKRIDVHFIESTDDPNGMGEPVIGPVGAATANAVFALTGKRLRNLPLKLDQDRT